MRAMKASEAVGRRFRVVRPQSFCAGSTKGRIGICTEVDYKETDGEHPVSLLVRGKLGEFAWCELELVEEGK